MTAVRSLLARVARLEQARADSFGWIDGFVADAQAGIEAGALDRLDMPVVIACVQKWQRDRLWEFWR